MNMNVLFDSAGLQTSVHRGTHPRIQLPKGRRLKTLEIILRDIDCDVTFTPGADAIITPDILASYNVFAITTRMPRLSPPQKTELQAIEEYVKLGGSLLVMSNHPWPGMPSPIPDHNIAALFDIDLEGPVYPIHGGRQGFTEIRRNEMIDHPITRELSEPIIFNNGIRIRAKDSNQVIVRLPGEDPPLNGFTVAIDAVGNGDGRVVIVADSGFVADDDTTNPGPGLVNRGGNKQFVQNIFEWLLHRL